MRDEAAVQLNLANVSLSSTSYFLSDNMERDFGLNVSLLVKGRRRFLRAPVCFQTCSSSSSMSVCVRRA